MFIPYKVLLIYYFILSSQSLQEAESRIISTGQMWKERLEEFRQLVQAVNRTQSESATSKCKAFFLKSIHSTNAY